LEHKLQQTRQIAADVLMILDEITLVPTPSSPLFMQPTTQQDVEATEYADNPHFIGDKIVRHNMNVINTPDILSSETTADSDTPTVPLNTLMADEAISLLVSCGCFKDLKERISANEDLEVVDITGAYLQELDDLGTLHLFLGTLHLLESNITESKRLARKHILKHVLAMMQEYQLNGIPADKILAIRSSLATCLTAVLGENPQHIILTSSTASKPVLSPHISKLHMEEAVELEKTPKSLLHILSNEAESLDKKLKACKALRELLDEIDIKASRNSIAQDELRHNNAIPIVLTLVQSDIPNLCEEGCAVLRILARNKANNIAIGEAGGISVLVRMLSDENSAVREGAAGALLMCP
jgi:hypothetical protein